MTLDKIKKLSIASYLQSIGCEIKNDRGYYGMYLSPYREDVQPSLKVDFNKNLWTDFGSQDGGSIIDLVMKVENCSFSEAIERLKTQEHQITSFSFHRNTLCKESTIIIRKIKQLENKALLQYLNIRKINLSIATQYCKEVYYTVNGKPYFAVGFKNDSGGFELRSKYFKGCTAKDITSLRKSADTLIVFEGFMDYLSLITLEPTCQSYDAVILNSLSMLDRLKEIIQTYSQVRLYLDNDMAGDTSTSRILSCSAHVTDCRDLYKGFKDCNDYLIAT